jgi:hypothetical protein
LKKGIILDIFIDVLKWLKYNGLRSIAVVVVTVWFLGFMSMKSGDDVAIAFSIVLVLLVLLLRPELKKLFSFLLNFYRKL